MMSTALQRCPYFFTVYHAACPSCR